MKSKKVLGFTLIELLIVITIIGILAVAFLPTLLGAPAKARDTQRIADLQKIQKVLVNGDLNGNPYPTSSVCLNGFPTVASGTPWTTYESDLGGIMPSDPTPSMEVSDCTAANTNAGSYKYFKFDPATTGYSFGLLAKVENFESSNAACGDAATGTITAPTQATESTWCYAILTQ